MLEAFSHRYPTTHVLEDGAKVTCSLMSPGDSDNLVKFLERLTRQDLSYLQVDITRPEILDRWLQSIAEGKSVCLCAYDPASLVGYTSVQISEKEGRRRGEIRVNISQGYRSRGLGRALIDEILIIARSIDLEVVTARMVSDQYGAISAFKRLGFENSETLEGHVTDASGVSKDLLVMTSDLSG